ncbi:hypothetical protein [Novacetimonas hansenii]|uniref:Uncharacterized protein n=1 Tax=Novacetimonas hansenii TaxID=436 RepID=A0AAW5EM52_NOVHA|nr:hypothetical protein [Novacetimonas hansenii]MCJ8352724.1 hypothetical protein [Novacetimonas hansenii]
MINSTDLFFVSFLFLGVASATAQEAPLSAPPSDNSTGIAGHTEGQTIAGFSVDKSFERFGVVYGMKAADKELPICQTSVAIYLDKFIQSVPELEQKDILSGDFLPNAYNHKYNLMVEFSLKFIQTLIPKAFALKPPANLCSFSSGFIWQRDGKKHTLKLLSFSIDRNTYNHIDWDKINYTDIPSVSLNYYIPPIYYDEMTRENQGFWK